MHTTSLSLLQRLKQSASEPVAWERFVHLYSPLLCYWSGRMGLSDEESLDVCQEVLLQLLKKLPEFEYDGRTFRGWLRTVLQNKCRDLMRRKGREVRIQDGVCLNGLPEAGESPEFLEGEHRDFLIRQALTLMKSEFQESTWRACWLTTVEGLSAKEAAKQLQVTVNAVFVARSRVLGRLREEFSQFLE